MGLFKPIWESKNPEKIQKFIESAHDVNPEEQRKLSQIAINCSFPELRHAAAKKIASSENRVSTMFEAKKRGDLDTVQALIDAGKYQSICSCDLFSAVTRTGDLELLSMLALKVKTLDEWNLRESDFSSLLNTPGFDDAKSHYTELKKTSDEAKREAARQKRKEAEKKRHEAFLRDPRKELIKASGKPSEKKLWREWYDFQLKNSTQRILSIVIAQLKDLNWSMYFPAECIRQVVLGSSGGYAGEGVFHILEAEQDLKFFLKTLYEQREETREEVLSLNGILYYEGREKAVVNFGDHHEDWFVTFDPLPAYRLLVFLSGNDLQIHLEEEASTT